MRIRALAGGELVDDDGAAVPLQRQAWRLTLFLATRPGQAAEIPEIVDALWAETPPPSARQTVHVLVNRIRRAGGPGLVERTGRGYRLVADLDLEEILSGFDRARELEPEDPAAAALVLESALTAGDGVPFGPFADEVWIADLVAGFSERFRQEEERWAGLRIRLGTATAAIDRLDHAARAQPLREVRWEQLMLALYRAGRQGEALRRVRLGPPPPH